MNKRLESHFFWGPFAPLSALTGAGLIIMASTRLAHAIICFGAILWVYIFTALVFFAARKIMPQKGKFVILLFLSSFICNIYLLLIGFLNPLLVSGAWFFMILIPPCCLGSGFFENSENAGTRDILSRIWVEATCLGFIIIALSLIREPLGLGSLSLPGGPWGFFEVIGSSEGEERFFPIRVLSVSGGGFLILGFGVAVFRHFRKEYSMAEDKE